MNKDYLLLIKSRLEEMHTKWYIASTWKDKRSRHKKMHEVSVAISDYANTLPPEVLGLFDTKVERAALSSQFAGDDIGSCIDVLEDVIKEMENEELS